MASNSKVDDVNGQKEQVIQALKENPASAIALSKMLRCDACMSFPRGPVRYCGRHHTICSICYSNDYDLDWDTDCPANDCKEKIVLFDRAPDGRVEICGFSSKPFNVKCQKTYEDIQLLSLSSWSTSGISWHFIHYHQISIDYCQPSNAAKQI